ncbi:MAG: methyltransferase domain-containing protein [Gammaproteobacteria bacterium]|nr:methyltransferase domain-containing protein [Gammaproteobacteria bacterium]
MTLLANKQQNWNQRYQLKAITEPEAAYVLTANSHLLADKGRALDLACGLGANAIFLARKGYQVTAVDYSAVALEKLDRFAESENLSINSRLIDLENFEGALGNYDLIVVSYYLQRELFPLILSAINSGGMLFYQTFSGIADNMSGPKNAAFRLKRSELLALSSGHEILYYREDPDNCIGDDCFKGEVMIVVKRD